MSYQNRWRDGFICMLMAAAAAYFFDLQYLWRKHSDLENELKRAELQASIQQQDKAVPMKLEAPSYLALLTNLLHEYHLQLTAISSVDAENYQMKVSGSYVELRQFILTLAAAAEFIINDIVIVSESEMNTQIDLNVQFIGVVAARNSRENLAAVQLINPFCSALHLQDKKLFQRDDISLLGTVRRGSGIHPVVMYPNGVIAEINK